MNRLSAQVALVTGAGRGIGRAIALAYAREGASVAVVDIDEANARAVAGEAAALGVKAVGWAVDLRDPSQAGAMIDRTADEFGALHVMVNNAGVIRVRPLLEVTPDDWDFINDINARGLFFALQAGARQMIKQSPIAANRPRGKIINMASIAGRYGSPMLSAYCASKTAAISITKSAALALAPQVTVNSICPGPVDTEMWKTIDQQWSTIQNRPAGSVWDERVRGVPMGRGETPEDLTGMAVFLASADSDFITGQSYHVDGGVNMN